jgi:hypothetical protein
MNIYTSQNDFNDFPDSETTRMSALQIFCNYALVSSLIINLVVILFT